MRTSSIRCVAYSAICSLAAVATFFGCDMVDWSAFHDERTAEQVATDFVSALSDDRINEAISMLTDEIRATMSVDQVREIWPNLILHHGAFVGVGEVTMSENED